MFGNRFLLVGGGDNESVCAKDEKEKMKRVETMRKATDIDIDNFVSFTFERRQVRSEGEVVFAGLHAGGEDNAIVHHKQRRQTRSKKKKRKDGCDDFILLFGDHLLQSKEYSIFILVLLPFKHGNNFHPTIRTLCVLDLGHSLLQESDEGHTLGQLLPKVFVFTQSLTNLRIE